LNFTLIPDTEKKIISKYGVMNDKGSARRVSFLIDEKGKIINIWKKVNTKEHAKEVLDFINS
jgi:peroxiredoxin Q/BCP